MRIAPHIHIITETLAGAPRGITLWTDHDGLDGVLREIANHRACSTDPIPCVRDLVTASHQDAWCLHRIELNDGSRGTCPIPGGHRPGDAFVIMDFPRGQISVQRHYEPEHDQLTPDGARALLAGSPYLSHWSPEPLRANLRVTLSHDEDTGHGLHLHFPDNGPEAISAALQGLSASLTHADPLSFDDAPFYPREDWDRTPLMGAIEASKSYSPLYIPFYGEHLQDEYEAPSAPPRGYGNECPLIDVDLAKSAIRLSDYDGAMLLVNDLVPECVDRVRDRFDARVRELQLDMTPKDQGRYGLHPDFAPF